MEGNLSNKMLIKKIEKTTNTRKNPTFIRSIYIIFNAVQKLNLKFKKKKKKKKPNQKERK